MREPSHCARSLALQTRVCNAASDLRFMSCLCTDPYSLRILDRIQRHDALTIGRHHTSHESHLAVKSARHHRGAMPQNLFASRIFDSQGNLVALFIKVQKRLSFCLRSAFIFSSYVTLLSSTRNFLFWRVCCLCWCNFEIVKGKGNEASYHNYCVNAAEEQSILAGTKSSADFRGRRPRIIGSLLLLGIRYWHCTSTEGNSCTWRSAAG